MHNGLDAESEFVICKNVHFYLALIFVFEQRYFSSGHLILILQIIESSVLNEALIGPGRGWSSLCLCLCLLSKESHTQQGLDSTWESARQSSRPSFEPVLCSTNKFNWDGVVMNQKVILKISNDVCWLYDVLWSTNTLKWSGKLWCVDDNFKKMKQCKSNRILASNGM